jgi:hypothetical protein
LGVLGGGWVGGGGGGGGGGIGRMSHSTFVSA